METAHGIVQTPAFMPVGTQGAVKGLSIEMVQSTGAQMILANTYHLALRPTEAVVKELQQLVETENPDLDTLLDEAQRLGATAATNPP